MKALNLFSLSLQLTDCSVQFDLVLLSHIYGIFDFCKSCDKATPTFSKIPKSSESPRSETDGMTPRRKRSNGGSSMFRRDFDVLGGT
jgi:hypothetical protein